MSPREWGISTSFRWGALLIGLSASVLGDLHASDAGRSALGGALVAGVLATAVSAPRLGEARLLFRAAIVIELLAAIALIATTDAAFSPFVLAAASPLVAAALSDRPLLVALSAVVLVGVPYAALLDPVRGIPVTIHATAVVLAVPWLSLAALSGTEPVRPRKQGRALSGDERTLLEQLAEGLTYAQIAEHHDVSVETVKVRVARLYRHLGASNRHEAVEIARGRPDSYSRS